MASKSIKGVSVSIGADTSDFIKGLKSIDKEINQTQKTANELQKGLKLEYNEKNFVQAQKNLQKALETTENKAESIRKEMQKLEQSGNVDTDGYRKLETELAKTETKAAQLRNQLEEVDKIKLEKATEGAKKLSDGLATASQKTAALSAAAAGAIAGITKLAKDAVETGDTIQTTADQYNLSAEAIQKWNYIALQSDVPAEQLYKSMTKARDAIGTALAGGTSTATKALETLMGDLTKVPTDTEGAFNTVIMALANVEDKTLQAYYANEIFGERVATQLIPLLNQGSEGLAQLGKEFESVGYLSNEQVRALADYDNELNKFNTRIENTKTQLGIALLPILDRFVDLLDNNLIPAIQSLTKWFEDLSPEMQKFTTYGLLAIAMLSPMLLILSKIVGVVPALITGFSNLNGVFSTISKHPIILILGVIAGLLVLLYTKNEQFRASVNELLDLLTRTATPVLNNITSLLADVVDLLNPIILMLGEQLAPIIEFITVLLEPLVRVLEYVFELIGLINEGVMSLFGKGTLWGVNSGDVELKSTKEEKKTVTDINSIIGNFELPTLDYSSGTTENNIDNSKYNIEVNVNSTGNLNYDANTLAEEVIKKIIVAKQSSGR